MAYSVKMGSMMPRGKKLTRGLSEEAAKWYAREAERTERLDLQVGPGGRIVIPAAFRKAMQVKEGDRVMARVVDGELRVITPAMGIRLAQKMVRETIPGNDSLADELIADRRREVEQEFENGSSGS
jgi:AbrB family looped-hinge helix DNA binding protein